MQPDFRLSLTLESGLSLSEDSQKVLGAMKQVLGDSRYSVEERSKSIRITSDDPKSIGRLHDQLRDRHVRAAARRLLLLGRAGDKTTVMVNRQAATAGVIALCDSEEESALGPMYLSIESKQLDAIVRWLTAYEYE